ncbi:hypothetical protein GCM10010331_69410 [Streptomyces xanthochromogenes]|uniref:hypothetical protein n=1 Tax=Streptomyces xanthochromogenes TaxID=67384 RepID=UPI00167A3A09|nr:hypothetical protein [Streptomyces xanthochromogenes]GHB71601.1 hypothetical protein GCM10010331_69410 [Streptomyces xanthochromogenes]
MNLTRKLAAGAMAAGFTTAAILAATPASATVVNSTCNLSSVVTVHYGSPTDHTYCYVWDGGPANEGWMDIQGSTRVCSNSYTGWVRGTSGTKYPISRNWCTATQGERLNLIHFDGN